MSFQWPDWLYYGKDTRRNHGRKENMEATTAGSKKYRPILKERHGALKEGFPGKRGEKELKDLVTDSMWSWESKTGTHDWGAKHHNLHNEDQSPEHLKSPKLWMDFSFTSHDQSVIFTYTKSKIFKGYLNLLQISCLKFTETLFTKSKSIKNKKKTNQANSN